MVSLVSLGAALVLAILYAVYRRKDQRLLRNGLFLVSAAWFAFTGVFGLLTEVFPPLQWVAIAFIALLPLAVLVLAVFLVVNGFRMITAEGRSLATLLSLLAGLALIVLPGLAVVLLLSGTALGAAVAILLALVSSYLGVVFVAFLCYSLVYARSPLVAQPAALVVLGSRIIDGQVPPLLRNRLDKAMQLYRAALATGPAPLLIPSGGKGDDETRSEGAAMAEYLLAQGADPADVAPETEARNTRENLLYSSVVQHEAGRPGPVVAVTNNYHVLRAAVLARQIGDAQVVGAPTARYYVPSAFLREYVAIVVEHKRLHAAIVLPLLLLMTLVILATNLGWIN